MLRKLQKSDSRSKYFTVYQPDLKDEEVKILKILSNYNEAQFRSLSNSPRMHIERMINSYYEELPVLKDLKEHGIKVNTLYYLQHLDLDQKVYLRAIPILVKWLKNQKLSQQIKAGIINILISRSVAKKYAFDVIIGEFKKLSKKDTEKKNVYYSTFVIMLGNAFIKWMDDDYAGTLFNLLEDVKYKDNEFLLSSLINFKNPENIELASEILTKKLKEPNLNNTHLFTLITALRKLKVVKARDLILPFVSYPKNYIRNRPLTEEEHGFVSDTEVRNEAKKAIVTFDKMKDNSN
jgi:hypothetical protein